MVISGGLAGQLRVMSHFRVSRVTYCLWERASAGRVSVDPCQDGLVKVDFFQPVRVAGQVSVIIFFYNFEP